MASIKTSLVLGSGGARGLAHIGVIRCLEDRGYDIRYVAGSSMGALIGGIYAAGKLDVYADWVCALQKSDIVRLLDWSLGGGALFKGDRLIGVLKDLIGDRNIEDLPVGYTAVATDLSRDSAGREVWLNRGPLFDAIRASIAVPTLFEPSKKNGRLMVDGGIVNPVPVAPTLNNQTDITVAVDLNGKREPASRLLPPDSRPASVLPAAYRESISRYIDKVWPSADSPGSERIGFLDLVTRSMETMQATITQFKLAASVPAVIVRIPRNLCDFFDFYRAQELIDYGYRRTQQALTEYEL
ncbi:MAG: patatin-like phospholipase family protein [Gammaproteobacteria bacterium]|nr:patatin-like phospholipase family protein [Gammaproteobacteria bacterium]